MTVTSMPRGAELINTGEPEIGGIGTMDALTARARSSGRVRGRRSASAVRYSRGLVN